MIFRAGEPRSGSKCAARAGKPDTGRWHHGKRADVDGFRCAPQPLVFLSFLAARRNRSTPQPATVARYWLWLDDPTEAMFDQLVKEFNATHPGIKVEYQIVPLSAYHDKLATAPAAGSGPDAWRFKVWWLGEFVKLTSTADRRRREGVGCWVEVSTFRLNRNDSSQNGLGTQGFRLPRLAGNPRGKNSAAHPTRGGTTPKGAPWLAGKISCDDWDD